MSLLNVTFVSRSASSSARVGDVMTIVAIMAKSEHADRLSMVLVPTLLTAELHLTYLTLP